MINIDWTKPVETTEDPPRPVRVLFDKDGRPDGCRIAGDLCDLSHVGAGVNATRNFFTTTLRNVALKPEPVLLEAWATLLNIGQGKGGGVLHNTEMEADAYISQVGSAIVAEKRRIAWMSDGSPVPGEMDPVRLSLDNIRLRTNLDRLRQEHEKAEARITNMQAEFHDDLEWTELRGERDALKAEVERLKPVVAAAMGCFSQWDCGPFNYVGDFPGLREAVRLRKAVRAVRDTQKNKETGHD